MSVLVERWRRFYWLTFVLVAAVYFASSALFWVLEGSNLVPEPQVEWHESKWLELREGTSHWEVGDKTIVELRGLGTRNSIASRCFQSLLVSKGLRPPPEDTISSARMISRDEVAGKWDKLRPIENEGVLRSVLEANLSAVENCVDDKLSAQYAKKLEKWQSEKVAIWLVVVILPIAALLIWFVLYRVIIWAGHKFS
jgi:hypothetical protein